MKCISTIENYQYFFFCCFEEIKDSLLYLSRILDNVYSLISAPSSIVFILISASILFILKSDLDLLESWIKISEYPFRHDETTSDVQNNHSYVIQHDMGMKVSIYFASLLQFLFEELGYYENIVFDKTENSLAFSIDIVTS